MNDAKLARIRALLDNAESYAEQGNKEAAETYRNKAIELMAAHGVEEAMLSARTHKDEKPIRRDIPLTKPYTVDKGVLMYGTARALGVQCIRTKGNPPHSVLVGFESDLERVEVLYTSLLVQAFGELAATPPPRYESTVSFRKAWLIGFTNTVVDRIEAAEQRARGEYEQRTGSSTALVVQGRSKRVDAEFRTYFPRVRKGRKRYAHSASGYASGKDAGERADIGGAKVDDRQTTEINRGKA
ncbi:DUF2786 domain-containing protein [Amycolatopsis cihanbeyliensis]|uniref:DUF2786 domain-containing protein n=1 Tax=Amycolatopsis cihanbeyliensis TaxID=1128664 RepID=A0A542DNI6_AMYCI|nr:DUF2786 domain-containing protein [Amycolatopsis cihanbeyliensis]TQJ04672.1 hypothetical protein FB471_4477 [Amycolatopsis cihanbeyliensis]